MLFGLGGGMSVAFVSFGANIAADWFRKYGQEHTWALENRIIGTNGLIGHVGDCVDTSMITNIGSAIGIYLISAMVPEERQAKHFVLMPLSMASVGLATAAVYETRVDTRLPGTEPDYLDVAFGGAAALLTAASFTTASLFARRKRLRT